MSADAGLQEVCCQDCGEHLGYQAAGTEVQPELWQHTRCPERIARQLGLPRAAYDTVLKVTTATISNAYPDFPHDTLGLPEHTGIQLLRAEIAAGAVLEALSVSGFGLRQAPGT